MNIQTISGGYLEIYIFILHYTVEVLFSHLLLSSNSILRVHIQKIILLEYERKI